VGTDDVNRSGDRDDANGDSRQAEPAWTWTRPQRRVLVLGLLVLCPALALRYACNRAYVPDPPPAQGPRYDEVADKIDPNTADVASLAALPMIGDKRAQDIVNYRERRKASEPGRVVFTRPEDFLPIRGFGRASVETLRPYLLFPPAVPPATRP
jgi:hypothetical protein